jgi:hypothetical protein
MTLCSDRDAGDLRTEVSDIVDHKGREAIVADNVFVAVDGGCSDTSI